ncbi:MAG TPA: phosphoribosyltransferase family protein [Patescibacteria group bacterium]|jgi:ComF family protein|nr:phosphoribosyltransferase family protein [Patescibacteria group bacterium]
MPKLLSFGLNILADVFYPKYCFGCRRSGRYLCKFCVTQIPACAQSFCIVCNKPSANGLTHSTCKTTETPDQLISAFPYQYQVISDMIITGKYFFVSETFVVLGMLAAEFIKSRHGAATFENFVVTPLPLHASRRRWRGFNQSELIASAFENCFNIPAIDLLKRNKNTKTQKDLDSKARQANMRNAFSATQEIPEKVILVDDVCTTGQTLMEAAKVLKLNGAKQVICITIAKD